MTDRYFWVCRNVAIAKKINDFISKNFNIPDRCSSVSNRLASQCMHVNAEALSRSVQHDVRDTELRIVLQACEFKQATVCVSRSVSQQLNTMMHAYRCGLPQICAP